jgi:hypothetical protein
MCTFEEGATMCCYEDTEDIIPAICCYEDLEACCFGNDDNEATKGVCFNEDFETFDCSASE